MGKTQIILDTRLVQTQLLEKSKEAGPHLISKTFCLVLCIHGRSLEFSFGSIIGKNSFLSLGHHIWILTLPYSFGQSNKTQKGYGSCHILPKLNKRAIQKFLRGSGGLIGSVPSVWICMGIPEFPLSSDPLPFSPLGPLLIISNLQVPSCPSTEVPITSPHANKKGNMRCLRTIKEN